MNEGAAGGETGRGGALARCCMAGAAGTLGAAGGFAAITGAAGGVMRGAAGLLRGFGCAALTGAGRATIGRFI